MIAKLKIHFVRPALIGAAAFFLWSGQASATVITYDEIVYSNDAAPTDPSLLAGTIDMTLSMSYVLTITLTNTSPLGVHGEVASAEPANNLLTGIGFNLPSGVSIDGGSANSVSSTLLNFPMGFTGPNLDVSQEWGYDNDPILEGPLFVVAALSYTTGVTSMTSSTDALFASGTIDTMPPLNGPDFGLLSGFVPASTAGALEAIQARVVIMVDLLGLGMEPDDFDGDLIDYIDAHPVALLFGSPTDTTIPEPGTLAIFAFGLLSLGFFARRRRLAA